MRKIFYAMAAAAWLAVWVPGPVNAAGPQDSEKEAAAAKAAAETAQKDAVAAKATAEAAQKDAAAAMKTATKAYAEAAQKAATAPPAFYRVDYSIYELEHGKRTNTRTYTLKLQDDDWVRSRVGNRIPITGADGKITYSDVGVNLDSRLRRNEDSVWIRTTLEISSVAPPAGSSTPSTPVIRNMRFEDTSPVELGKATLVGALDDATSDRRYEVEITATKIK